MKIFFVSDIAFIPSRVHQVWVECGIDLLGPFSAATIEGALGSGADGILVDESLGRELVLSVINAARKRSICALSGRLDSDRSMDRCGVLISDEKSEVGFTVAKLLASSDVEFH